MAVLRIEADSLYRAVIAHDFKVLAYYLDLSSGQIVSRTLKPDEVQEPPPGPSVPPLPLLGGDLSARAGEAPFGPPPADFGRKPCLFQADSAPSPSPFAGDFFKRDPPQKINPFGDGGLKRESGAKKLARLFGEEAPPVRRAPCAAPTVARPRAAPATGALPPADHPPSTCARIPPARAEVQHEWRKIFARECGAPEIRVKLEAALAGQASAQHFDRVLQKFQRLQQQWLRYSRRQALHYARAWLAELAVEYEVVEPEGPPRPA